jgi:hypothetical protein
MAAAASNKKDASLLLVDTTDTNKDNPLPVPAGFSMLLPLRPETMTWEQQLCARAQQWEQQLQQAEEAHKDPKEER